jgi:hypothetical protein
MSKSRRNILPESGWRGRVEVKRSSWAAFLAVLCAACTNLYANEAIATCATQADLQNKMLFADPARASGQASQIASAADVPVWKTISVGTFLNNNAVLDAFRSAGCGIGDTAEEMLSQIKFNLSTTITNVDLVALTLADLGFDNEEASLTAVYSRALKLGFELAAPEVGPQLRLQYSNQPIGEFLDIGMAPIKSQDGKPGIFIVANGGAGLLLIAREVGFDAKVYVPSRFVFVRPLLVAKGQK